MSQAIRELESFLESWTETPEQNKKAFVRLKDYMASKPGVNLDFIAREGLTYSLRAAHENQKNKPLFVMVDVIEDTPRWLSVCFYNEMITDPDENGDFVPEGRSRQTMAAGAAERRALERREIVSGGFRA